MWRKTLIMWQNKMYLANYKIYNKPSKFGINNGKISKLLLTNLEGKIILNYDRGFEFCLIDKDFLNYILSEIGNN